MAALISSICCTLIILAFCQVIVETILPEGSTKRYVVFIAGLVALAAMIAVITTSGPTMMKSVWAKTEELQNMSERQRTETADDKQTNPYQEYIEKLIESYR